MTERTSTGRTSKVVQVTGGASGIGAAVARRRAAAGDHVVIADVDRTAGERVAADGGAVFVPTDVRSLEDNERAVAMAVERFGRLDAVFLNAGIHAALPHLRTSAGAIVVTSSLAGLTPGVDLFYAATKHALIGLVRSLSMLVAEDGITVNALCPGFVDTPMVAPFRDQVVAAGWPIAHPDHVAAAFDHVLAGGDTGQAWIVTAGAQPQPASLPQFPL
jgi:NAD(P)-dependent dehydrogenase (short-subunit alcohol dehydrogenase family)